MTIASCFSTGSVPSITPTTFEPIPSGWCSVTFFIVITLPVANDAGFSDLRMPATSSSCVLPVPGEDVVPDRLPDRTPTPKPFTNAQFGLTMK